MCPLRLLAAVVASAALAFASEFPERECCDPVYPVATTSPPPPPSATVTHTPNKTGLNVRTSLTILNCLLARQLCFEDASCSAILEIIPRVCGSELVACSTVTVTKCQAALRTLQAFPFFKPTCLCREPNVDPECNSFRDFLFDHPCVFVQKKEKDPYPVEALPTCNYALNVCHAEKACAALFDTFKLACRARDGDCRMEDRDQCREAWTGLRMSPLFGCICPNNHMKKRCDRIFAMVNHNPCIEGRSTRGKQDLFMTRQLRLRHAPKRPTSSPPQQRHPDKFNLHPNQPEYVPTQKTYMSLEYKSNVTRYVAADGSILLVTENGTQVITNTGGGDLLGAIIKAMKHKNRPMASFNRRHPNVTNKNQAVSGGDTKGSPPRTTLPPSHGDTYFGGVDLGPDEGFIIDDHHVSPHIMEDGHRRTYGRSSRPRPKGGGNHHGTKRLGEGSSSSGDDKEGGHKVTLHSTCHLALDRCIRDKSCTTTLTPVLQACDASTCDREGCMESLQTFYRTPNVQWNLEIAFCLCKKTDKKDDPCMNAQEKLHPVCAQREPGAPLPACHVLAQTCREQPDCRSRLEVYEQSCAVDSVTRKCAGSPEACRTAVLDMLGTELRTACACKGTDFNQLYDCLGWQRLLWLNPCVVESQSDFHIKTYGSVSTPSAPDNGIRTIYDTSDNELPVHHTTVGMRYRPTVTSPSTHFIQTIRPTSHSNLEVSVKNGRNIEVEIQGSRVTNGKSTKVYRPTEATIKTTEEELPTTTLTTTEPTTTTEEETTTAVTTTTTTAEPVKYCIVQRPEREDQFVQRGHTRRLYRDSELECSELCHCDNQLSVSCHAVCVRHAPCRTALAFYNHAGAAYQAYRGRCYCYSGSFICMKPSPGEYSLPPGVYLFLGFSSQDEALLRPHTRLGLEDAVRILQEYMMSLSDEKTNCTLTLFNVTNENMIVSAGVPSSQKERETNPLQTLDNDKTECISLLKSIKMKINSQDYDISSHLLLSIFKIAEVDIVDPPPSSGSHIHPHLLLLIISSLVLIKPNMDFFHGLYSRRSSLLLMMKRTHKLTLVNIAHVFYIVKKYNSIDSLSGLFVSFSKARLHSMISKLMCSKRIKYYSGLMKKETFALTYLVNVCKQIHIKLAVNLIVGINVMLLNVVCIDILLITSYDNYNDIILIIYSIEALVNVLCGIIILWFTSIEYLARVACTRIVDITSFRLKTDNFLQLYKGSLGVHVLYRLICSAIFLKTIIDVDEFTVVTVIVHITTIIGLCTLGMAAQYYNDFNINTKYKNLLCIDDDPVMETPPSKLLVR